MASLHRALALPEVTDGSGGVADDLHLDMTGIADQAFDIDLVAPEGGLRLGATAGIGFVEFGSRMDRPHTAPAAAGDCLDHDGATGPEPAQKGVCLIE